MHTQSRALGPKRLAVKGISSLSGGAVRVQQGGGNNGAQSSSSPPDTQAHSEDQNDSPASAEYLTASQPASSWLLTPLGAVCLPV